MAISHFERLSPELVLVDAALAVAARARLLTPADTLARQLPDPVAAASARHTAEALRRITELAELDAQAMRKRSRFRIAKVAGALATWSTFALLLADTRLYDWSQLF